MRYSLRYLVAATALVVAGTAIAIQSQSKETDGERTYVGQQTCVTSGCHAGAYEGGASYKGKDAFKETMHQKIHHRPTPENVVIDRLFREGKELKYWDNRIRAKGRDTLIIKLTKGEQENDYYIQLKFSNGGDSLPKMKVVYNYGGTGWLQRYLVELNGNYYVAPFQYVLPSYRSTSDTGVFYFLDLNRWYKIDANTENGVVFLDWNSNSFRAQSWDKNCSACHVNGFDVTKVVTGENGADTTWYATWAGVEEGDSAKIDENISIGCESCHGPGSEHSANPSKTNILSPKQLPNTKEATDIKLDMCNQCHKRLVSLKGEHAFGYDEEKRIPYIPGTRLKDFTKPGPRVWADGQTSTAHHQQGDDYEYSLQYKDHLFVGGCADCHLSHSNHPDQPFQLNQDWYTLEDGKGCMSCHGSPGKSAFPADNLGEVVTIDGKELNKHSRHAQSQSACVNCHFTTTNTIAFTGTMEFTDHSFRVFSPKMTLDFYKNNGKNPFVGMINTCASECHRNGRGPRNDQPGDPEAPFWGIVDRDIYSYKEPSDSALAELLWMHYKEMYKDIMKPSAVPGEPRKALNGKLTLVTPNPFVTAARIDFSVTKATRVKVEIYGVDGRHVRTLADRNYNAGNQQVLWEGDDDQGMPVLSGSYFVRLSSDGDSDSRRIVLAR